MRYRIFYGIVVGNKFIFLFPKALGAEILPLLTVLHIQLCYEFI